MARLGRWMVGVVIALMLAAGLSVSPAQAQVLVRVGPRHRRYYHRRYYGHPYHRRYYRHHGYYR